MSRLTVSGTEWAKTVQRYEQTIGEMQKECELIKNLLAQEREKTKLLHKFCEANGIPYKALSITQLTVPDLVPGMENWNESGQSKDQ